MEESADAHPADRATWLDLYDWRERVAALYRVQMAATRAGEDATTVLLRFRAQKDALFAAHPQSPLGTARRRAFTGLPYFPPNPALRIEATLTPLPPVAAEPAQGTPLRPAAQLRFPLEGAERVLVVYWVDVYGGGLFLPFRDTTCGPESYGGGRYLFDTVKGSDFLRLPDGDAGEGLGYAGGRVLLDFNYAYNPSCAYDARWICPLAPPANRLPVPIRAGERRFLTEEPADPHG